MDVRTPLKTLVRLAKILWRIEHDYRELKHGLGLAHCEGRSFTGWHRHVTLTCLAQAFLLHPAATRTTSGHASLSLFDVPANCNNMTIHEGSPFIFPCCTRNSCRH